MNTDELTKLSVELFGKNWQTPLAAALGIEKQRVQQWLNGKRPIPDLSDFFLKELKIKNEQIGKIIVSLENQSKSV